MSKVSLNSTITEESEPTNTESKSRLVNDEKSSSETTRDLSTAGSADSAENLTKNLEEDLDDVTISDDTTSKISEAPKLESESSVLELPGLNGNLESPGRYIKLRDSFIKTFLSNSNEQSELSKYFRVTNNAITILSAQEPWPKDVQLFQPYEVEQILLPDNANCLAVQTFLKMCQLEYKVEARSNADAMSPTGRVPFIKCGAFIVSELEGIVQFVGSKGISLTSELDAESKADMRAYMTLVNNVLGNAELYLCWCDNETYNEVTKPRFGSVFPWPLNHVQAWSKRQEETKRLKVIGWCQKSLEEVYNDVETCCQALTDRLDNNQFFFGSKPTELEALIFGHLYTILTTPLPNAALANIVKNFPKLIDLITRLEKKFFQRETQH